MRLLVALLCLSTFAAQADVTGIDLIEPGSFPISNVPVRLQGKPAIVSFSPRKEPTTFVIDEKDLTVTESKGFIGDPNIHSLVIEQGNVRILVLRPGDPNR